MEISQDWRLEGGPALRLVTADGYQIVVDLSEQESGLRQVTLYADDQDGQALRVAAKSLFLYEELDRVAGWAARQIIIDRQVDQASRSKAEAAIALLRRGFDKL